MDIVHRFLYVSLSIEQCVGLKAVLTSFYARHSLKSTIYTHQSRLKKRVALRTKKKGSGMKVIHTHKKHESMYAKKRNVWDVIIAVCAPNKQYSFWSESKR